MHQRSVQSIWRVFVKQFDLDLAAQERFQTYVSELLRYNELVNLTAARTERELVELHCADSLMVSKHRLMARTQTIADVGSGAGFPGIALAIKYPEKPVYVLEVNHKKIKFLEHIIGVLQLNQVHLVTIDWRTFLRKTNEPIDLFCARASLAPEELIRMFKPSCPYNRATLVYWASALWQPSPKMVDFVYQDWPYHLAHRKRRLIVLQKPYEKEGL